MTRRFVGVILAMLGGCGEHGESPRDAPPVPIDVRIPAELVAMPMQIDFGSVSAGEMSSPAPIVIVNAGGETSSLLAVQITETPPGTTFQLENDTCTGASLAPSTSCRLDVVARPATQGTRTGTLQVEGALAALVVTGASGDEGFGLGPAGTQPYGTLTIGQTSAAKRWTLTNSGGHPHGPVSVTKAGGGADQFTIIDDTCSGVVLAAGSDCHVDVVFAPTIAGVHQAAVTFAAPLANTVLASMSGIASDASGVLAVNPTGLDFGQVGFTQTVTQSFTVTNTGASSTGSIAVARAGDPDFTVTSHCTVLASAGDSCTVDVTLTAASSGPKQAAIIFTPANGAAVQIGATGYTTGPPMLWITSGPMTFGSAAAGTTGPTRTLAVINESSVTTGAIAVGLGGTAPDDFVIGADTCTGATLANEQTCSVDITFMPGAPAGPRSATVTLSATPGGSPSAVMIGSSVSAAASPASRAASSVRGPASPRSR